MKSAQKFLLLCTLFGAACASQGGTPPNPNVAVDFAGADLEGVDLTMTAPPDMTGPPQDLAGLDMTGVKQDFSMPPPADMTGMVVDMTMPPGPDMAMTMPDLAMTMPDLSSGGSCSPGASRCGMANSVEICNVTGTAWLHVSTCAVSCSAGLCTGACTPAARRCNAMSVEECNGAGTAWNPVETCTGTCSSGKCALASLDVTMNRDLNGEVVVDGDFIVRSGVTVTVSTGWLTVRARNVIIENMGSITVTARGSVVGRGSPPTHYNYDGGGGGNGTVGGDGGSTSSDRGRGGEMLNSNTDAAVSSGGNGANAMMPGGGTGGTGGGVLRLIASDSITVTGFITANGTAGTPNTSSSYGGGGGGAGGGILLAASKNITVAGSVSARGGAGGKGQYYSGGTGAAGRVRILAGEKSTVTGTIDAVKTQGLLPPLLITSSTHPEPSLIYNDDFDAVSLSWISPFSTRQGYYHLISTNILQVPTPATGTFINTESASYPPTAARSAANYFHIVPVDAMTNIGTVENNFLIQVNSTPPTLTSTSHPTSTSWYMNRDVFFAWSLPVANPHVKGAYYVLDNYGSTIPTKADTLVLMPQKQLLRAGLTPGIWVMHILTVDQQGYLTKAAAHFRVQIGDDPGNGALLGQVVDGMGKPIDGATVTVNRGLWTQTTNSSGNYNIPMLSAGTYELRTAKAGRTPVSQMVTITKGGSTTGNVTMP